LSENKREERPTTAAGEGRNTKSEKEGKKVRPQANANFEEARTPVKANKGGKRRKRGNRSAHYSGRRKRKSVSKTIVIRAWHLWGRRGE